MFGGYTGSKDLKDLWVWDRPTNTWSEVRFAADNYSKGVFTDFWRIQITWDEKETVVPRLCEHAAVLRGDYFVIHGGFNGGTVVSARTYAIDVVQKRVCADK